MTLKYPVQYTLYYSIEKKKKSAHLDNLEQVEEHPEVNLYSLWRYSKAETKKQKNTKQTY